MRLSLHSDYALRILMFLARGEASASVDRIASAYGISRNHLMKVAGRLAELGIVKARRGRGGGLMLAQAPADINVGAVVRAMENLSGFVECFDPATNSCPIAGACGLQGVLSSAVADFLARLDRYTVADLVPDARRFKARLELAEAE
jgi:Rrf2 family nitric oxide-sensitive transcriptional repressor